MFAGNGGCGQTMAASGFQHAISRRSRPEPVICRLATKARRNNMKGWLSLNDDWPLRDGKGRSIAQHGELFQGQIEDENSNLHRCLLSLPCKAMYSQATFHPDTSSSLL